MLTTLPVLLEAVRAGLTGWKAIQAAIQGGKVSVLSDSGQVMSLAELESHVLAAENARDAAAQHAVDRIDKRHQNDS